jgi:hypothetical protein
VDPRGISNTNKGAAPKNSSALPPTVDSPPMAPVKWSRLMNYDPAAIVATIVGIRVRVITRVAVSVAIGVISISHWKPNPDTYAHSSFSPRCSRNGKANRYQRNQNQFFHFNTSLLSIIQLLKIRKSF